MLGAYERVYKMSCSFSPHDSLMVLVTYLIFILEAESSFYE